MTRRPGRFAVLAALVAGCLGPAPTLGPSRSHISAEPTASARPASSSEPSPSPVPSATAPATGSIEVFAVDEVAYVGVPARFQLSSQDVLSQDHFGIASVTVGFGDATTATTSGACGRPAAVDLTHRYHAAGTYVVRVDAAELCGASVRIDAPTSRILILPAPSAAQAAWPSCTTFQLSLTGRDRGSSLGNGGAIVTLRNVSASGCQLSGYPGMELVGTDGSLLPAHITRATTGAYLFPAIPLGAVALSPGGTASFQIGYAASPNGPQSEVPPDFGCFRTRSVRVILPGVKQYGTADLAFAPCGGLASVTPVFPGSVWISFQ